MGTGDALEQEGGAKRTATTEETKTRRRADVVVENILLVLERGLEKKWTESREFFENWNARSDDGSTMWMAFQFSKFCDSEIIPFQSIKIHLRKSED